MVLELTAAKVRAYQPHNLDRSDGLEMKVMTGRIKGIKSIEMSIEFSFIPSENDGTKEGWVVVDLNRNNARYLRNFIDSYLQEIEIDPDDED